jgi:hypothetical protein
LDDHLLIIDITTVFPLSYQLSNHRLRANPESTFFLFDVPSPGTGILQGQGELLGPRTSSEPQSNSSSTTLVEGCSLRYAIYALQPHGTVIALVFHGIEIQPKCLLEGTQP